MRLLILWVLLAAILNFSTLTLKPLWTDEFATVMFSLGQSFSHISIDTLLDIPTLLAPLQSYSLNDWNDVIQRLLSEDTHPPLYFLLNHVWMQAWMRLFPSGDGLVSVAGVRSLSALFGILCVPAMFGLGWVASGSRLVAHLSAVLMAVSPFGLFLAQESRHYSLATLWVILSLMCCLAAIRSWRAKQKLSLRWCLTWIVVNALGIATHYFFGLILFVQAVLLLVLVGFDFSSSLKQFNSKQFIQQHSSWKQIIVIAIVTAANGLAWLSILRGISRSELIQWVYTGKQTGLLGWINPIVNLIVSGITMLTLFPIQGVPPIVVGLSGLLTIGSAIWIAILVWRGLRQRWLVKGERLSIWAVVGSLVGAMTALILLDYGLGTDVTRGFRFNFLYLPSLILLVAMGLAPYWQARSRYLIAGIVGLGVIGSLTVGFNFGYQKVHQPQPIVEVMQRQVQYLHQSKTNQLKTNQPAHLLIAAPYRTHAQTTRLMSLAWGLKERDQNRLNLTLDSFLFYLDQQQCVPPQPEQPYNSDACRVLTPKLQQVIASQMLRPFGLWLINYQDLPDLSQLGCEFDRTIGVRRVDGFKAQPYRCLK